ncbi:prolyl oligopeptidase family serine peptidase [Altererythrobacter aerius]|uniref:Prolyl oligopeptidase family serine peptidase n=2 Tax=Tsuneonella aeria TaxID=1837929 RepID=A0A6I4TDN4_9SPHN|nr:prolyl oligopeptidase family serine peptidase [Tsuneonella aeria]
MSAQDLVVLPRLGAPAASNDGSLAIYPVTTTDPATYVRSTALHLRSLTDGDAAPIKLDFGGSASSPAFADDGWVYFLSDRGEGKTDQVWRARVSPAGVVSEISQVTAFRAPVAGFAVAPGATRIAAWGDFARTCTTFGCDDKASHLPGPGTGRLYDSEAGFVRHWDQWETPGEYSRVFAFPLTAGKAIGDGIPLDGKAGANALVGDTPTKPFGGGEDLAWAADGRGVFFAARKADADEPGSTNIDLWFNDLSGRAPTNLTRANSATDTLPAPSPDGKWLAYAAMARPGYEADKLTVMLRDLKSGRVRALTTDWDRSVGSLAWTPDSRWIVATAQDVLDTPAFRIDPATGRVEKLDLMAGTEAHIGNVVPLARGDLLFTRDSIGNPSELYLSRGWAQAAPLTDVATTLLGRRAPIVTRRFSFAGADGATVWGQITKLDGQRGKMPAILYVHGGPQGSFNDAWSTRWNPRVVASQGYAVVSIDFHGSTGYGQAFTDSITNDWGGKPLEDLRKGFAAAGALDTQVDTGNACAMGASYGGYMMNWIAGQWPDGFKCLVNHNGVFDQRMMSFATEEKWFIDWEHGGRTYSEAPEIYERWNPINHVAKWKTPMLIVLGERDYRIPYSQGLGAFSALQRNDVPAQLLVFPDENHWVLKPKNSLQWHNTVFDWLGRWLKPRAK